MWSEIPVSSCRFTFCHLKSFIYMKLSLFSVRSFTSIVVNTVCNIGILLDFSDQASCSDGMDSAWINKKYITLMDHYFIQNICESMIADTFLEFFFRNFFCKSVEKACPFCRIHHIPHLGLSILSFIFQCVSIIRMYLNGKVFFCINKFDQNRELLEGLAVSSQNLFTVFINILLQSFPCIFSVYDITWSVRMTGKLPGLCQRIPVIFNPKLCS